MLCNYMHKWTELEGIALVECVLHICRALTLAGGGAYTVSFTAEAKDLAE